MHGCTRTNYGCDSEPQNEYWPWAKHNGAQQRGKYATKPAIWTDWNKFVDAEKTAAGKADALLVAVKSGNKGTIETAFGEMGKNGCGGCHETFREKLN